MVLSFPVLDSCIIFETAMEQTPKETLDSPVSPSRKKPRLIDNVSLHACAL